MRVSRWCGARPKVSGLDDDRGFGGEPVAPDGGDRPSAAWNRAAPPSPPNRLGRRSRGSRPRRRPSVLRSHRLRPPHATSTPTGETPPSIDTQPPPGSLVPRRRAPPPSCRRRHPMPLSFRCPVPHDHGGRLSPSQPERVREPPLSNHHPARASPRTAAVASAITKLSTTAETGPYFATAVRESPGFGHRADQGVTHWTRPRSRRRPVTPVTLIQTNPLEPRKSISTTQTPASVANNLKKTTNFSNSTR